MRNTTISSSITTASSRVNGCFVGAISVLRSFLHLTFMREHMGYWQEQSHTDRKYGHKPDADCQPGTPAQLLWLAIAAPANQLVPATALSVRSCGRRRLG